MSKNVRGETLPTSVYTNFGPIARAVELEFPEFARDAWTGKISVTKRLGRQLTLVAVKKGVGAGQPRAILCNCRKRRTHALY